MLQILSHSLQRELVEMPFQEIFSGKAQPLSWRHVNLASFSRGYLLNFQVFPGHSQVSPQAFLQLFRESVSKHISWRSPCNNFTVWETEVHVLATVTPQTSSLGFFSFQCFPFVGNMSSPSLLRDFTAGTHSLCCILAQSKDPRPWFHKVRHCSSQPLKQTPADLFSSTEHRSVFLFCHTCCTILFLYLKSS